MGQHEAAREATKRAIALNPTLARAQANLALESFEQRGRGAAERAAERAAAADRSAAAPPAAPVPQSVAGARARPLQPRARVPAEGLSRRGAARVPAGARGGRGPPAQPPGAWPRCTCCGGSSARRSSCTTRWCATIPDSPKLWNERGVCLHQAGRRAEAVASYERAVGVDSAYQLAWNNLGVVRAPRGRRRTPRVAAFRQALGADRARCSPRGSTWRCCSFQRRQFQRGAGGVSAGARRAAGQRRRLERRRARADGAQALRGRAQRVRPRGRRRRRTSPRRTTT